MPDRTNSSAPSLHAGGSQDDGAGIAGSPGTLAAGWLATALLAIVAVLSLLPLRPPELPPEPVPADAFSAHRAMAHVRSLATRPRPIGSTRHGEVRDWLADRLRELGVEPRVQAATVVWSPDDRAARAARVRNVVARLPGRGGNGRAVLLMAHYDSVPSGPGAADDAAGVAALLETLRALLAGPALRNDVIFLFTDAEEEGLLGARAFAEQHPTAADVALVVNLEARGVRGPSILFEIGPRTPLDALRAFADRAPHVLAASYSADVYRRLPNDTDFSVFRERGVPGFNFAFIHGSAAYHTRADDLDNLDLRSLQHHGAQALTLARHFGSTDLAGSGDGRSAVYFSLPGLGLVVYPGGWSVPLAVLALVVAAIALGVRLRRGASWTDFMPGLLAVPGAALVTALGAALATAAASPLRTTVGPAPPFGLLLDGGALLLGLAAGLALLVATVRRYGLRHTAPGALAAWALISLASALVLPSSAYLTTWPTLGLATALLLLGGKPVGRSWTAALLVLCSLPAVLLWVPTLVLITTALGAGSAPVGSTLLVALLTLLLPAATLLPAPPRHRRLRWLAGVPATAGVVCLLLAAVGPWVGDRSARANSILYAVDSVSDRGFWISHDEAPDAWTERYLGSDPQRSDLAGLLVDGDGELLLRSVPALDLPPPRVTLLAESTTGEGTWRARVHLASTRGAPLLRFGLDPDAEIRRLSLDGRTVERATTPWRGEVLALPEEGVELEVELARPVPLPIVLVDLSYGLPAGAEPSPTPRPPGLMPDPARLTDVTLVRNHATLEPGQGSEEPPAEAAATPARTQREEGAASQPGR